MLVLLAAALIGDLVMLPALLAGPTGRWFKSRRVSKPDPDLGASKKEDSVTSIERDEIEQEGTDSLGLSLDSEEQTIPQLRLHFPPGHRADSPHRLKRK